MAEAAKAILSFTLYDPVYVHVRVTSDDPKEVKKLLTYIFASMTYFDQNKAKKWECKEGFKSPMVYFFNKEQNLLPIGLVPRVCKLVQNRFSNVSFKLDKSVRDLFVPPRGELSIDDVRAYAATLNIHNLATGNKLTPYEHQIKLATRAINGRRISLLACTSAGKSLSMMIIARYLVEREQKKVLIVVPSTNLVEQLFSDFHDDYGWEEARDYCTLIYSNSDDKLSKRQKDMLAANNLGEEVMLRSITISTWQSLQNKPDKFFECFTAVMVDEAHSTRGEKLRDILSKCVNAIDFKIGLSGTLPDTGIDAGYIESQLGRKEEIIRLKELVAKGILTPVTVNSLWVPYPRNLRTKICSLSYDEESALCMNNTSRRDVMKLLIDSGKITTEQNTVILFRLITNLELMEDYLRINYPQFKYHVIKGDISTDEREAIRKSIEYSTANIILATYGCMKQGVNIKLLHNLVMADPAKSQYMVVQSVGRIVRPHPNKPMAYVYDIVDDASYYTNPHRGGPPRKRANYGIRHYEERKQYYDKDDIPINDIHMDGIYEAQVDMDMIAEKRKKAADKAAEKAKKSSNRVFKKKFFM